MKFFLRRDKGDQFLIPPAFSSCKLKTIKRKLTKTRILAFIPCKTPGLILSSEDCCDNMWERKKRKKIEIEVISNSNVYLNLKKREKKEKRKGIHELSSLYTKSLQCIWFQQDTLYHKLHDGHILSLGPDLQQHQEFQSSHGLRIQKPTPWWNKLCECR